MQENKCLLICRDWSFDQGLIQWSYSWFKLDSWLYENTCRIHRYYVWWLGRKNYWICLRWEQSTVCMPQGYEFSWAIDFSLCRAASHCILAPFGWVATLSLISRGPSPMIFLGWIPCTVHWWPPVLALVGTQKIIGDRLIKKITAISAKCLIRSETWERNCWSAPVTRSSQGRQINTRCAPASGRFAPFLGKLKIELNWLNTRSIALFLGIRRNSLSPVIINDNLRKGIICRVEWAWLTSAYVV